MSDVNKPANRIPFETIESFTSWSLPSLGEGGRVVPTAQREASRRKQQAQEPAQEPVKESVKPVTAQELQTIVEQAEKEGREQGYREGHEEGLREGQRQGMEAGEKKAFEITRERLEDEAARLSQLADALMQPLASQDQWLENTLVEMSVEIARHLINRSIDQDPAIVFGVVERAVESLPVGAENVSVYLHPDDLRLVQEHCGPALVHWTLLEDSRLQRGGCRVASSRSLVDYTIEHRLAQFLEQVKEQGDVDSEPMSPPQDYRPSSPAPESQPEPSAPLADDPSPAQREAGDNSRLSEPNQADPTPDSLGSEDAGVTHEPRD